MNCATLVQPSSQDHLGSASVMMQRENGVLWGGTAARYKPFGGYAGDTPGNYIQNRGFTGHDRTQADDALGVVYMNARVYMPSTGKFLTPDTLVPNPANSQSYNRYTYVHNNPINLTDPSGHAPCVGANQPGGRPDPNCSPKPTPPSYQFNPQTGFHGNIQNWYPKADSQNAIENADRVLRWLTRYEGDRQWWDEDESGMPSEIDIVAWLLDQEGATTIEDEEALLIMARIIRYRLRNGLTPESLAGFTAFFNPNGGVDFTEADWDELMTPPSARSRRIAENAYKMSGNDYVVRDSNGDPVLYWWTDEEDNVTGDPGVYYSTDYIISNPHTNEAGTRVPRQTGRFYFGTWNQCVAAGATPCR